jgi:hypothetical protein
MDVEECGCHNLQSKSQDHSTDDGDDEDADDADADADRDAEAEDDELISGCHELDISSNPVSDVRSGSVLIIFVSASSQSQDMASVENAVGLKQLWSPGSLESVSTVVYIFVIPF